MNLWQQRRKPTRELPPVFTTAPAMKFALGLTSLKARCGHILESLVRHSKLSALMAVPTIMWAGVLQLKLFILIFIIHCYVARLS